MSSVFAQRRQKLLSLKALRAPPRSGPHRGGLPRLRQGGARRELVGHRYVCPCAGTTTPWGPITA